ncbi:VOC family protein [Paenibacillus sp. JCM 10914]|uniref:VOC family protein n=1 Tax=Paenibacillus sp. JCM 10914 TaxID=1236974 RepID=UPI0003CC7B0B|nr:PhnB protein [Paenibacillus sp. JCM 10914]
MEVQLTPFIMLDGHAKEAIAFYEQALDAQVVFQQTYGEAPGEAGQAVPESGRDRVAHSVLKIGGADLFVADSEPGVSFPHSKQVNICITVSDQEQARRYYDSLREGGRVDLELQAIHFSPLYDGNR